MLTEIQIVGYMENCQKKSRKSEKNTYVRSRRFCPAIDSV